MILKTVSLDYDKDNEFVDDGLIYVHFIFGDGPGVVPLYISVATDDKEPDSLYYEAHDQSEGFNTTDLSYSIANTVIELRFSDESEHTFFWNNAKKVQIEIDAAYLPVIKEKMAAIWSGLLPQ